MKAPSFFSQLFAILALPFMATVGMPFLLFQVPGWDGTGMGAYVAPWIQWGVGSVCLLIGLLLFIQSVVLFIRIGKGTLAPWNPTRKLVVKSLYRHTRNPMILGVFFILLGEGLMMSYLPILVWAGSFFLLNHLYFILKEEPGLLQRFGEEYREYKAHVPRWFPRLRPWRPEGEAAGQKTQVKTPGE